MTFNKLIFTKLIRFIIVEPHFRLQSTLFIIFAVVAILQLKTIQSQAKQLKQIKLEKEMIARIPDMEKKLMASAIRAGGKTRPQIQMRGGAFVLRGTSTQDGIPRALIDETVYREGDSIGDYTVLQIAKDSVVLENKLTKETKNLHFDN